MFPFSDHPEQALVELESFLDQVPQDADSKLLELSSWIERLDRTQDYGVAEKAVKLIGTAVGVQHDWQGPFRENGILTQALRNLDPLATPPALTNQYLRVIGNSVADNDINREIVSEYFAELVACLDNEELIKTGLAVLFNHGNDFDPAHQQAAESRLDKIVTEKLAAGKIPDAAIDFATDILTWTTEKLTQVQLIDSISLQVFDNLLKISPEYDEDHVQEYIAILVHYLQDPEFQQKVATLETVEKLVDLMLNFESNQLTEGDIGNTMHDLSTQTGPEDSASETNVILMTRVVNSLSAMSASDAFMQRFTLESPVIQKLKANIESLEIFPSTVCSCVILGNLATSDLVCIEIVTTMRIHLALIQILGSCEEQALLYAAAGFMRHLTFPESNRAILGQAGLIETCCRLLMNHDPTVRGEAAAILSKLASSCFPNIKKMIMETLPSHIKAAQLPETEEASQPSILHYIVMQALAPSQPLPSTTMKNPIIELGRTLVAILRYIRRSNNDEGLGDMSIEFFKTPLIARPVARLVRQRFYADARSEGLLGLGLMAQSPDGALCVVNEMKADEGLLNAVKEFAVEQRGDAQKTNESAGRDHQNAVVLLHGLATNAADAMDETLKRDIDSLQTELGSLMV